MNSNPYFTIWFRPVKTIDSILSNRIAFDYRIPILLAAISENFDNKISEEFGFGLIGSILILLIFVGLGYFIIAHFFPWWVLKIGKIWNGKSKLKDMQIIFGLANIPISLILIYQLLGLFLGEIISKVDVNYGLQVILWIFFIRILIIGIAKTQGFTYGMAIVNMALSIIPFIILELMFFLRRLLKWTVTIGYFIHQTFLITNSQGAQS